GDGGFAIPLAKRLKIPLVVTFHGYDATWTHPKRGLQWGDLLTQRGRFFRTLLLEKRTATFTAATRIIAVSSFIRDCLLKLGCPAEKITVHYIGIDTDLFHPDPGVEREPVVLFVGRLTEKKGCEYLIRAMARVQQSHPEARLVIIGEGPLRSQLTALAQHSLKNCTFLGVQPPASVRDWMNRAYCLCGPSITAASGDAEGLGMVFAEAQAMALPVVAFASGGIPEVVQHQQTGLLVSEKDSPGLAAAITTLFESPAQRNIYAQAGIQHIHQTFNLKQNTQKLEEIYDQVRHQYSIAERGA
ncbi:MAG: glycosyltransferase, partial [Cyanobacteria bacterium J06632_22]